ncbi:slightly ste11-like protein [Coniosporium tulheliwenetii]|uniref:Slightly ste11-like protein n=1 Tax=Coniosporium tulheliwenetii TaxID=3383036 RepID=A0ACC2ZNW5_9PEZI|nr:slightly ste11-like protein [Cladosporium sp. JES 115]
MSDRGISDSLSASAKVSPTNGRSPNSSRRGSTSTSKDAQRPSSLTRISKTNSGPPTPDTPEFFRITRKRGVASIITDDKNDVADTKSPTFILYRQHHQAVVAAQYPRLSNPEISKIIGHKWKALPDTVKDEWKALAEEEKVRHQQQYPEYKFQPRRNGRRGSLSEDPKSASSEKYRCNKCGGRTIVSPSAPPPAAAQQQRAPTLPPPTPTSTITPVSRFLPTMNNLSLQSPGMRRARPIPPHMAGIHVPSPRDYMETDMLSPMSPEAKRRRFNSYVQASGRPGSGGNLPFSAQNRRESLPRMDQVLRSPAPGAMAPPPRPVDARQPSGDLTLPPLQTGNDQSRSVEAMVMSMSYLGKVKVLAKITPPLKTPGSTSPASAVRGAIVAIEGEDVTAVQHLVKWLEDFLNKSGDCNAKAALAPKRPAPDQKNVSLGDYLAVIGEWHGKSKEMIEFITTPTQAHDSDVEEGEIDMEKESKPVALATIPVVILPTYQLHASDVYASRIPIADAYSPADHWQWMATLWRGIVGPDITIYIKDSSPEEIGREKIVDVREDCGCVVVRKEKGQSKIEERALRRMGFEVGEWIRGINSGKVEGR